MSWNIYAVGKTPAVLNKVVSDAAKQKCGEPEETIKGLVVEVITKALNAFPASYAVRIEANGSQFTESGNPVNTLNLKIEPIYGYVE